MKNHSSEAGARLEIPRLREMRISVSVLPTDEDVDSFDMAYAIHRALRQVPEIQAIVRGDVDDPRFDFPADGWKNNSLTRCRIPRGDGFGLMSERDAADALGVTKRTLQRWAVAGTIESTTHLGQRRIPRGAVADRLADREGPDAQLDRIAAKLADVRRQVGR